MKGIFMDDLPIIGDKRGRIIRKTKWKQTDILDQWMEKFEKSRKPVMKVIYTKHEYTCPTSCASSIRNRIRVLDKPWKVTQINKEIYIYKSKKLKIL